MTQIEAILVPVEGKPQTIHVNNHSLVEMQRLIGGFIEAIGGAGWSAYMDEDGKGKGLPLNTFATAYAIALGWVPMGGDYLVGPVVFTGASDSAGYDTPVTARVKRLVFDVADPWSSGR